MKKINILDIDQNLATELQGVQYTPAAKLELLKSSTLSITMANT